jgi:DNA polymerase-3 subunit beta
MLRPDVLLRERRTVKFRVDRDVLAEAVAWAARSLPTRPSAPVLAGLLLEAEGSTLTLSGFDLEVSGRVEVPADVDEPGRALVSGRLLADIARALPPLPVECATDGPKVAVRCGQSRFTLLTLPVEDYPSLPDMPSTSGVIDGSAFAAAVAQVAIAAGRDDTLPALTGIRVEITDDVLTLAATDRYRLAVRELPWKPERSGVEATALVPARTLNDTAKALTGAANVEIAFATRDGAVEALIGFEGDGRRTTTRLIDGEFPKYRSLLPNESQTTAIVETAALIDAVKRVALVAERNTPVRLSFTAAGLGLEAGTGDEAQAQESVEAQVDGDEIVIAFNPQYLLDGLGAVGGENVRLAFTTSNKPAVLSSADDTAGAYRYLLMPVRIGG